MRYVFLSESAREREAARLLFGTCEAELDAVLPCDLLVLPIPLSRDNATVCGVTKGGAPCTLSSLTAFLSCMKHTTVIAYARHEALGGLQNVRYLTDDECFMKENARLTAEGGLALLLSELKGRSLADFSVSMLGYGRIARAMLPMLAPMAKSITVYARRASALRAARRAGYRSLPFSSLADSAGKDILLINTVPSASALEIALDTHRHELLLELACTGEIVALCEARKNGAQLLRAPSMPMRYAPIAAGRALSAACVRLCGH